MSARTERGEALRRRVKQLNSELESVAQRRDQVRNRTQNNQKVSFKQRMKFHIVISVKREVRLLFIEIFFPIRDLHKSQVGVCDPNVAKSVALHWVEEGCGLQEFQSYTKKIWKFRKTLKR